MGRVSLIGPAFAPSAFAAPPRRDRSAPRRGQSDTPALAPGEQAFVRLRLEAPAILARGDRYILRAYSPAVTMAGGLILDPRPPRTGDPRGSGADEMPPADVRSGRWRSRRGRSARPCGDDRRCRTRRPAADGNDLTRRGRPRTGGRPGERAHRRQARGADRRRGRGIVDLHAAERCHRRHADRASQEPALVGRHPAGRTARAAVRARPRGGVRSRAVGPVGWRRHLCQGSRRAGHPSRRVDARRKRGPTPRSPAPIATADSSRRTPPRLPRRPAHRHRLWNGC